MADWTYWNWKMTFYNEMSEFAKFFKILYKDA